MIKCVTAVVFFFFQAEDGIRDYKVTGVQTCALPISSTRLPATPGRGGICQVRMRPVAESAPVPPVQARSGQTAAHRARRLTPPPRRSEERRVGKEGRSRWSPYH